MEKLRFPVIRKPLPSARKLSMNEYLEFVQANLKLFFDRKAYRARKKKESVNVLFSLKT